MFVAKVIICKACLMDKLKTVINRRLKAYE